MEICALGLSETGSVLWSYSIILHWTVSYYTMRPTSSLRTVKLWGTLLHRVN